MNEGNEKKSNGPSLVLPDQTSRKKIFKIKRKSNCKFSMFQDYTSKVKMTKFNENNSESPRNALVTPTPEVCFI